MPDPEIKKTTLADVADQAQSSGAEPQGQPAKPESLFFNVMPKIKHQDPSNLVQPTLKVEQPSVAVPAGSDFFKKNKLYLIIGAGIIILGVGIYFVANEIGSNSYK